MKINRAAVNLKFQGEESKIKRLAAEDVDLSAEIKDHVLSGLQAVRKPGITLFVRSIRLNREN